MLDFHHSGSDMTLGAKIRQVSWGLVLLLLAISAVGLAALYSAAGGDFEPWASRQFMRIVLGFILLFAIALTDIKFWYRMAWPIYGGGMVLLAIVEVMGRIGMGAQRWIDLGFIQLQPSELMKIAVVLALARYFHAATLQDMRSIRFLAIGAAIVLAPVTLVMFQPDLGTSLMILIAGAAMFFLAGAPAWMFGAGIAAGLAALPVAWTVLHDYQKQRVLTFLDPSRDPLGAGYHITQSKIALGSGGWTGKGFLEGTQSRLDFLPEKQTDFIFTLWVEEWGLLGGWLILALFGLIFAVCAVQAFRSRHAFGRLLGFGLMVSFSLYVFINTAMVTGLIPVVGAPLPLVSYGGTAILSVMAGFGLILSCAIHRDAKLPRM